MRNPRPPRLPCAKLPHLFTVLVGEVGEVGVLRSPKVGTTAATLKPWVGAGVDPATLPQHVALYRPGQGGG